MFRKIRITLLLVVLFAVAMNAWVDRANSRNWERTLRVAVYPVNGDHSQASAHYIGTLEREDFLPVETYFRAQGQVYDIPLKNLVDIRLAPEVAELPPTLPAGASMLDTMLWSLKLRYWAFRVDNYDGPAPEVKVFMLFFDPATHDRLPHSVGLEKGLIGVVQAYAGRRFTARNNVVFTHELLHTVGASDKYNPRDNLPLYPGGYAEPDRHPRLPQSMAEIMGGRIPITETRAVMPKSLAQTLIGPLTALEINWLKPDDGRLALK
ncbi:MAG TPA: hypothetical protein ENJ22_03165 [Gammaproteobacteria bacterium]|nr:hypothetical protein [Gammaproteobacteria bacterium]